MDVLPECMSVSHLYPRCPCEPQEEMRAYEIGVTVVCSLEGTGSKPGEPLEEHPMLLVNEASLQFQNQILCHLVKHILYKSTNVHLLEVVFKLSGRIESI